MQMMGQETVAKIIILNERSEALILTVGEYKERPDKAFKPDLPGGMVENGEPERIAAAREIEEETGIDIAPEILKLAYANTESYPDENKSVTKLLYVCRLSGTPKVTISWEHARFDWVAVNQLSELELRPFYRRAIDYCLANGLL